MDLKKRLITSVIIIFLLIIIIFLSSSPVFMFLFVAGVSVLVGIGIWEYFQLAKKHEGIHPNEKCGIAIAISFVWAVFLGIQYNFFTLIPWTMFVIALFISFIPYWRVDKDSLLNSAVTMFGVVYIAFTMSLLIPLRYLDTTAGCWWLIYTLVVTKITDVGAFTIGNICGKHLLAPKVSPKKTKEGFLGGIIFAMIGGGIIVLISGEQNFLTMWQSLFLAMVIGFLGQLGDLAESLLKRSAGVKDSNTLPGLGGVLDMVDSLLFTIPVMYIVMRIQIS